MTGGFDPRNHNVGTKAELLHANGTSWCKLPSMQYTRRHFYQAGTTACGGNGKSHSQTTCYTLEDGEWVKSAPLEEKRIGHVSWTRPDGKIHLLGGFSSNTTEIVDVHNSTTEKSFALKHSLGYFQKDFLDNLTN